MDSAEVWGSIRVLRTLMMMGNIPSKCNDRTQTFHGPTTLGIVWMAAFMQEPRNPMFLGVRCQAPGTGTVASWTHQFLFCKYCYGPLEARPRAGHMDGTPIAGLVSVTVKAHMAGFNGVALFSDSNTIRYYSTDVYGKPTSTEIRNEKVLVMSVQTVKDKSSLPYSTLNRPTLPGTGIRYNFFFTIPLQGGGEMVGFLYKDGTQLKMKYADVNFTSKIGASGKTPQNILIFSSDDSNDIVIDTGTEVPDSMFEHSLYDVTGRISITALEDKLFIAQGGKVYITPLTVAASGSPPTITIGSLESVDFSPPPTGPVTPVEPVEPVAPTGPPPPPFTFTEDYSH